MYTWYRTLALVAQAILLCLPYVWMGWVYSLVLVAWMSIITSTRKSRNSFDRFRVAFLVSNTALTLALIGVFAMMLVDPTNSGHVRLYQEIGLYTVASVECCFAVASAVLGYRLLKFLGRTAYSRRFAASAVAMFCSFGGGSILLFSSTSSMTKLATSGLLLDAIYYSIDLFMLGCLMGLFRQVGVRQYQTAG